MQLVNQILYYVNTIGLSLLVACGIGMGIIFYFVKVRKVTAREENINTQFFDRVDAISYIPIKDILYNGNLDREGIIAITDTLFVGGVNVRGFDYASASAQERLDAELNSVSFFNVVDGPTTFRQSVKSVDLSSNIAEYERIMKDIAGELMVLDSDYRDTLEASKEAAAEDPDSFSYYQAHLDELQLKIEAKNHQLDECNALVSYMQSMTKDNNKNNGGGVRTSQILFSYEFDPSMYSTELSKGEIYERARVELDAKARSYMNALAFCHFRASRMSARDLVDMLRRYTHPLTGSDERLEELMESSYSSLFLSSDNLVKKQIERIGEEEYKRIIKEHEEAMEALLREQTEAMEDTKLSFYEQSLMEAMREVKGEN